MGGWAIPVGTAGDGCPAYSGDGHTHVRAQGGHRTSVYVYDDVSGWEWDLGWGALQGQGAGRERVLGVMPVDAWWGPGWGLAVTLLDIMT